MGLLSLFKFANTTDIKRAISNPSKAVRTIRQHLSGTSTTQVHDTGRFDTECIDAISTLFDISPSEVETMLSDLRQSDLQDHLQDCRQQMSEYPFEIGGMEVGGEAAYLIARLLRPDAVLEIGVANGVSTAYLLHAADMGGFHADFRAIDKPLFESTVREQRGKRGLEGVGGVVPDDREAGWIAPRSQRHQHGYQYYVGDFTEIVEPVATEMDGFELALYDASKDRAEMESAYETLIKNLNSGGVLVSDDIAVNSSFNDVSQRFDGQTETFAGCGIFRKQ